MKIPPPNPPVTRRPGFTLVELLVVLAIIGILASLIMAPISRARERANTAYCVNNLRQLKLAMQLYGDDFESLLPAAHGFIAWTNTVPEPWTRPLLPYYVKTNILKCPSMAKVNQRSPYSYFMGSWAAGVESKTYKYSSVNLKNILYPSQYILSGDTSHDIFNTFDADPDNYTWDTLFAQRSKVHAHQVNVLFADGHVSAHAKFKPNEMTFSYQNPGVNWHAPEQAMQP